MRPEPQKLAPRPTTATGDAQAELFRFETPAISLAAVTVECDLERSFRFPKPFARSGSRMLTRLLLTLAALALFSDLALPQSQGVPPALALPQGAILLGKYAAQGVQIYVCRAKGAGNEWAFKAPEADLVDAEGRPFAKHYAGPSWDAPDGSKAVGKVLANEPAPNAGAIPWLLLSTESSGSGELAGVRFVQRVNTSGGAAPSGPCPTVGAEQRVDYTADYIFYK